MSSLTEFLRSHPDILQRLPNGTHDAYLRICGSIAHLRSRMATNFFISTFHNIENLRGNPSTPLILRGAKRLAVRNWTMTSAYFESVSAVSSTEVAIEEWTLFAVRMADSDVECASAFLKHTPAAVRSFGPEHVMLWGELAIEALKAGRRMGRAVKAYLEEAVSDQCATPLEHWNFLLDQAERISLRAASAAEAFIRLGTRVCLLLNDSETVNWVDQGLEDSRSEEELVGYFSGTTFKSLEKRDSLTSGIVLQDRANMLSLMCEAYLGRRVKIRSNNSLIGVQGFTGGPATDGRTIFLPEVVPRLGLFKLMALHQAALLEAMDWRDMSRRVHPTRTHVEADQRLLKKLPALLAEMKRLAEPDLPEGYSDDPEAEIIRPMPWWGDLLPHLVKDTDGLIQKVLMKAEEKYDLPPAVVEALLTFMMAEGKRDFKGIWDDLQEAFDNLEFLSPEAEELEESFKTFMYKEWDTGLSDYKLDWCLVRQRMAKDEPNAFAADVRNRLHGLINLIRRQFLRLKPEQFRKLRAQEFGDDLDWEALIPAIVEMKAGGPLTDSVYIRRDKRSRDVAVLFLVDMSGSTEEMVGGRRVIDLQKEAMVLMAEALDSVGDPFAIFGFTSEGRYRVDLFTVKDFGEPYGEKAQYRLGNLEPKHFTRLGTAIRHGIYKLNAVPALIKLMVILTDGRPYDLEYGTLSYAVADTHRALREARRHRIHPFIITSDQKGSEYMKLICPQTQSIIVPKAEQLPTVLPAMYKRLTT